MESEFDDHIFKSKTNRMANESVRFFRIPKDTGTMNTDPGFDIVFCKLMILVNNLKRKLKVNSF